MGYLTPQVDVILLYTTVFADMISIVNARRCFRSLADAHIRPAAGSSLKMRSAFIIASPDVSGGPFSAASTHTPGRTSVTAKSGFSIGCVTWQGSSPSRFVATP